MGAARHVLSGIKMAAPLCSLAPQSTGLLALMCGNRRLTLSMLALSRGAFPDNTLMADIRQPAPPAQQFISIRTWQPTTLGWAQALGKRFRQAWACVECHPSLAAAPLEQACTDACMACSVRAHDEASYIILYPQGQQPTTPEDPWIHYKSQLINRGQSHRHCRQQANPVQALSSYPQPIAFIYTGQA